jgi:hypothetical protein
MEPNKDRTKIHNKINKRERSNGNHNEEEIGVDCLQ